LLHLPLEPAKGVLEGFPLLKPHFSHAVNTPSASQSLLRLVIIGICLPKSSDFILFLATKDKGDSKAPHSTAALILPAVIALAPLSSARRWGEGVGQLTPAQADSLRRRRPQVLEKWHRPLACATFSGIHLPFFKSLLAFTRRLG
jgi:hypothetical protein